MGVPNSPNDNLDLNSEAVRQVNELTDSEPVNGEDLLESEDLKQQLREAKEKEAQRKLTE